MSVTTKRNAGSRITVTNHPVAAGDCQFNSTKLRDLGGFDCSAMSFTVKVMLWHGKSCEVPREIAVCPECGSELYVYCQGWHTDTGQPLAADLQIECEAENWILGIDEGEWSNVYNGDTGHSWKQSDWQSVREAIVKWAMADTSIL